MHVQALDTVFCDFKISNKLVDYFKLPYNFYNPFISKPLQKHPFNKAVFLSGILVIGSLDKIYHNSINHFLIRFLLGGCGKYPGRVLRSGPICRFQARLISLIVVFGPKSNIIFLPTSFP